MTPTTTKLPAISEEELDTSMRKNIAAGALGTVWLVAAYGLPLPLFAMEAIRASGFHLGLMGAVRRLAVAGATPFGGLPGGADGAPEAVLGPKVAIIHRLLWLTGRRLCCSLLWPDGQAYWILVVIAALGVSEALGNAATAQWLSWMARFAPGQPSGARFWGSTPRGALGGGDHGRCALGFG